MDARFLNYDRSEPARLVGWRILAEAEALIGPDNLRKLGEAGLRVSADTGFLIERFGSGFDFEDPDTGHKYYSLGQEGGLSDSAPGNPSVAGAND